MFHPSLPDPAWHAFRAGDHDTPVFEAFKAFQIAVRKTGLGKNGIVTADYGVELMKRLLIPTPVLYLIGESLPLAAPDGANYTGTLGELQNPKAHHDPAITVVAVEEIMVASALHRIVDST